MKYPKTKGNLIVLKRYRSVEGILGLPEDASGQEVDAMCARDVDWNDQFRFRVLTGEKAARVFGSSIANVRLSPMKIVKPP